MLTGELIAATPGVLTLSRKRFLGAELGTCEGETRRSTNQEVRSDRPSAPEAAAQAMTDGGQAQDERTGQKAARFGDRDGGRVHTNLFGTLNLDAVERFNRDLVDDFTHRRVDQNALRLRAFPVQLLNDRSRVERFDGDLNVGQQADSDDTRRSSG